MANQDPAYKEALNELLDAFEKLEPIVQKAKQARKEMGHEEYIKVLEEQNRILKERVQHLEDNTTTSGSCCPWENYNSSSPLSTTLCGSFSWNSLITFFICLWVFLVFLGF
jgi:hypothetical protein